MQINVSTYYDDSTDTIIVIANAHAPCGQVEIARVEITFPGEDQVSIKSSDTGLAHLAQVASTASLTARLVAECDARTTEDTEIPLHVGEFAFDI